MRGPKANDRRSPLPRQTGRGDFPHPAFARVVFSRKHSQRHQAQVLQVSRDADARPCPPAPLAASAQMAFEPLSHEPVEVPERLARTSVRCSLHLLPVLRRCAGPLPRPLPALRDGSPVRRDCRSETASVVWLSVPASVSVPGGSAAAALPERKALRPPVLS